MGQTRIQSFLSAYKSFSSLVERPNDTENILQDALIQRFEYTLDACWKMLKTILFEKYGVEVASPKIVFREAFKQGIISDSPLWIEMVDDRNMTSHVYNEETVSKIVVNFKDYNELFNNLAVTLQDKKYE